jgi:hypothetical protein
MINLNEQNYIKINLAAQNEEDLVIFSTLCQDSLIKISNIKWAKKSKRFYILLTRLCWELNDLSKKKDTLLKRINSILIFDNVLSVKSKGIRQSRSDMITSLLTFDYNFLCFEKQSIDLIFSGDAQITIDIECIEAFLKDVSEPFESTSSKRPDHQNDYEKS